MKLNRAFNRAYGWWSIIRHGCWFVDIPRTSSSSIRVELGRQFGKAYGKTNLIDARHSNVIEAGHSTEQIFLDHTPAIKMRSILGKWAWNRIFTFTIVRNPWDRIYSMYRYRQRVKNIPPEWSFRNYVLALEKMTPDDPWFRYHGFRYGASDYVVDSGGRIIVDYIAKYENRDEDLSYVVSNTKLHSLGKLHIQQAASRDDHYSYHYDSETEGIVRDLYSMDIELFDYKFEGP